MEIAEAKKLLDIPDEFSPNALKSAFRRASFLKHPDAGGSQDEFVALMQAFEVLKPCASAAGASAEEMQKLVTVEGTPLSELGKGYPLTVSARTCDVCGGLGYREFHEKDRKLAPCSRCGGTGLRRYACKKCGGSGDYKHPKTGKVVGKCYLCDGSGWFYPVNKNFGFFGFFARVRYIPGTQKRGQPCTGCESAGEVWQDVDRNTTLYTVCTTCKGVGEVKMANPVIPRGYLVGRGK